MTPPGAGRRFLVRLGLISLALGIWFWTQSLIGARACPSGAVSDAVLEWLEPVHRCLAAHEGWANSLLIVSSAGIDIVGIFLLGSALLGPSLRPFIALIVLFGLRQICQATVALPAPEGMIWRHPGFPSLLVTYGVATDLFFSGHTGLAVLGALELCRRSGRGWRWLGLSLALFEALTVLVLRAHYSMDVLAGALAAGWAHGVAVKAAPSVDRWTGGQVLGAAGGPPPGHEAPLGPGG